MTNRSELKSISKIALIKEIIERTKACAFLWHVIAPGQFRASNLPFEFYLTKTRTDAHVLDVWKDGKFYRTYNSSTVVEVADLYSTVDILYATRELFKKLDNLTSFVGNIQGPCAGSRFNTTIFGGVRVGSSALVAKCNSTQIQLLPVNLSFGATLFPWSGTATDIDEGAVTHDGDGSFIRQQVSGTLPTNWGYVFVQFNPALITLGPPYRFLIRTVSRREAESGVIEEISLLVNNAAVFSDTVTVASGYQFYNSGNQDLIGIDEILSLEVRINMFTNVGNANPRALRISAVDITITGLDCS